MDSDFSIDIDHPSGALATVRGQLDIATAPALRDALLSLINEGATDLVVDLEGVSFVDSTGLGVLVSATKRVQSKGGSMTVICTRPQTLKVLKITGLESIFAVRDTLPAALRIDATDPIEPGGLMTGRDES
ncbi:MAG TPA: STAS domain-containing protein [Mycobacteriales bacterium]|nr:STAS domain-containing protein [Mycobacteriales bacterium]